MDQNSISRRTFLGTAAMATAMVAGGAALQTASAAESAASSASASSAGASASASASASAGASAGSAGSSSTSASASAPAIPTSWDYECDLLVIGYGGAGMWASLIGADECAQNVLILEKAPLRGGGNSSINNGEWTVIKDKDKMKEYIRSFTHGETPDDMIDAWVEEADRNTEYADKYGMDYEVTEMALAGTIPEYAFLPGGEGCCAITSVDGFGMHTFDQLDAVRTELGAQILFDCHDERLIQDPDTNAILGCYTMIGDEEKTVKARKGTILTLGGFEFNEELKDTYLPCHPFKFEGWRFNTGDGIKMVQDVGANLWHMGMVISMYSMYTRDPEYDFSVLVFPPANSYFVTNRLGKRYVNENTMGSPHNGWHTLLHFDDSIDDFDRIPSWCVMDQAVIDAGPLGTRQGDFFECGNFASALPDELRDWNGWDDDNSAEIERGWIIKGDTLDDLIAKMQEIDPWMDADNMKATFDEYKGFCENGVDGRFDRSSDTMVALAEEGPYYAYTIYPGSCSTLGGPEKNANAQVLDTKGNVIPRLYSAGCFGNFQSHSYGITGGNNCENMVWGRIAARHAASLENWDA